MSTHSNYTHHIRKGFTLLEIIVVVMIIAVLATMVLPRMLTYVGSAKHATAKTSCDTIAQQILVYHMQSGLSEVPDGFDLELLLVAPEDGGAPGGPFLTKADAIIDPWGRPFEVLAPGEVNYDFDVISWGEDGEPGGEGVNEDITQ